MSELDQILDHRGQTLQDLVDTMDMRKVERLVKAFERCASKVRPLTAVEAIHGGTRLRRRDRHGNHTKPGPAQGGVHRYSRLRCGGAPMNELPDALYVRSGEGPMVLVGNRRSCAALSIRALRAATSPLGQDWAYA